MDGEEENETMDGIDEAISEIDRDHSRMLEKVWLLSMWRETGLTEEMVDILEKGLEVVEEEMSDSEWNAWKEFKEDKEVLE